MNIAALLDTETTGLLDPEHRIVEVYIDLVNLDTKKTLFTYDQRINPKRSISAEAQRVHGISHSDVAHSPDWETVGPVVHKILSKANVPVAHNAEFDMRFLNMEFVRIGLPMIKTPFFCTMENGIWASSNGKKPSLQELCFACEVPYDPALAHAASYDVRVMGECLLRGIDWGFYCLPNAHASQPQIAA